MPRFIHEKINTNFDIFLNKNEIFLEFFVNYVII